MACHLVVGSGHLCQPPLPLSFLCPFRPKVVSDAQYSNEPHQKDYKTNCLIKKKEPGLVRSSINMGTEEYTSSGTRKKNLIPELLRSAISLLIYKSTVSPHLLKSPYFTSCILSRSPGMSTTLTKDLAVGTLVWFLLDALLLVLVVLLPFPRADGWHY